MKNTTIYIITSIVILIILAGVFSLLLLNNNSVNTQNGNPAGNTGSSQNNQNSGDNQNAKTYNINIQNFKFSPATLIIKKGEAIVWTNMDSVRHTVTSDSGNELDSSLLSTQQTYSHTFTKTGTYAYHCTPHPNMKATIIVE